MFTLCRIACCTVGVGKSLSMFAITNATTANISMMIMISTQSPFSIRRIQNVGFLKFVY